MARNESKLEGVASIIREKTGVKTQVVVCDFSTLDSKESVQNLEQKIAGIEGDVSILVNNVGLLTYGKVAGLSITDMRTMININVNTTTYMTTFLLPRLLHRRNKRSAIINLTSKMGYLQMADFGPYGASKSYVQSLTGALREAYSEQLDVMLIIPGSVKSGINPGTMPNTV